MASVGATSISRTLPAYLGDWNPEHVIEAIRSIPSLINSDVGRLERTILRHNVNGPMVQQEPFPTEIVNEMFDSKLKRRKFLSTLKKWRIERDRLINIRTSDGESCTLSQLEFSDLSFRTRIATIKTWTEAKIGRSLGRSVVIRSVNLSDRREHQLVEGNSLAANGITQWGATIFMDTSPKTIVGVDLGPRAGYMITESKDPETQVDMITGDCASREFPLVRMCCANGWIGSYSMSLHIRDSLRRCQYEIFCPNYQCRVKWDWDLCARIACFTPREARAMESKRAANLEQMTDPTKTCPNCGASVSRPMTYKMAKVRCLACHGPEFCWRCLKIWGSGSGCGNSDCPTEILLHCQTTNKWASTFGPVPVLRACPRCDGIMEYASACRHIICPTCSFEFCLICLGTWSGHGHPCSLAPRQRM